MALLVVAGVGEADASSKTWVGGAQGDPTDWNEASNWDPAGVPAAEDAATIPGALPFYPILATTAGSVRDVAINSGGSLTINPGANLTLSGKLAVDGVLNLSGGTLATEDFNGSGTTSMSGGTLQVGRDFEPAASNFFGTGGTVEWTGSGGGNAFPAGTYCFFNIVIDSGANPGFDNKGSTIEVAGNWLNNGSATLMHKTTTVIFNGAAAQVIGGASPTAFDDLTISNGAGVALATAATVNSTLTLAKGILTTGGNAITLAAGATVSGGGAGSYVNGNLWKAFTAGYGQSFTFPIGDASNYTPVSLSALDVTTGGWLEANTTAGQDPSISSSGINPAKDVNRYWTLTPLLITVSSCTATFNFAAGDVDPGANPANFVVERHNLVWSPTASGARGANFTSATGLSAFGDFAIGDAVPMNIQGCCQMTNHHALLSFVGPPSWACTLQASTDLKNWTNIGNVTSDTNGVCQFEDVNAPSYPYRFYRTMAP